MYEDIASVKRSFAIASARIRQSGAPVRNFRSKGISGMGWKTGLGEEFVGDTNGPFLGHGQRLEHVGDISAPGVAKATVSTTDLQYGTQELAAQWQFQPTSSIEYRDEWGKLISAL